MALLTGFNVTLDKAKLLGEASLAAFAGTPIPAGYTVLKPSDLGLAGHIRTAIISRTARQGRARSY
jgi:hypothetical protein